MARAASTRPTRRVAVDGGPHAAADRLLPRQVTLRDGSRVRVTVTDEWQHRGLGTVLLNHVADRAREEGIDRFTALVAGDNAAMQPFLAGLGGAVTVTPVGAGALEYEIRLEPKGLGKQLETLLRAAAAGHWQMPPRLCDALRALVPINFSR